MPIWHGVMVGTCLLACYCCWVWLWRLGSNGGGFSVVRVVCCFGLFVAVDG